MDQYILVGKEPQLEPDRFAWARWYEAGNRVVARTMTNGGVEVSTVFLGLNHAWGDGPPLLFETALFTEAGSDVVDRYSTWAEAEVGHMEQVETLDRALATA